MSEEEYPSSRGEGLRSSSAVVSPLSRKEDDEKKEEEERNDTNNSTKTKPIPVDFASMRRESSGQSIASSQGKRSRSDLLAAAEEEKEKLENNNNEEFNTNTNAVIAADRLVAENSMNDNNNNNNNCNNPFQSDHRTHIDNDDNAPSYSHSPSSSSDLPKREGEKERKSLRPTNNNYNKLGSVSGEDIGMMMANNASNGSNSLGESPTTRLDYLNQATFDLNKSKRVVSGNNNANNNNNNDNNNNNNAISSNANEGKPPKHDAFGNGGGEQTTMFAENSAVARVALDAHAARAPSPAEGMDSKLLRVRSMVTLDGAEPDLAAMGGGSSAEGSLEATDDEDALMTDEEVDVGAHDRNNQRQGGKEVDSPTTKSKQTSENDGGANLDRSGHSDGSVRSAEDGATNEATTLAKKQPKATLKPPARVLFGVYEAQGQRPYMEDRYAIIEDWKFECAGKRSQNNYYNNMNNGQQEQIISDKQYIGVYDGHNGDWAASYAKEKMHTHLEKCAFIANGIAPDAPQHELEQFELGVKSSLIRSFVDLDEEILDGTKALNRRDGSTASVVLRVANHLFVAHAGDTRIVVGKRAVGHHDVRAKALTEDHKPSLPRERKRVYDEGGRVEFCGCWRVIAENRGRNVRAALAVSRAIGDIDFKRPENKGVTATPDVARVTLDDEIENVIVATDGLWDVIGDQDAVRLCRSVLRGRFSEDACREAAEALTQEALERGSSDNVTVVVCCFQH